VEESLSVYRLFSGTVTSKTEKGYRHKIRKAAKIKFATEILRRLHESENIENGKVMIDFMMKSYERQYNKIIKKYGTNGGIGEKN